MIYGISKLVFIFLIKKNFKLKIYGTKNLPDAPFILASNHASILDPPLVGIACKKHHVDFMAKTELFDTPFWGPWFRLVKCIEVKRGESGVGALKEAVKRLKQGRVVGIFPEGERSIDGNIREAKKGAGFLIAKAGVPVVPVYVNGSWKAYPKGGPGRKGTPIDVFVGKPLSFKELSLRGSNGKEDYEAISSLVMGRIEQLKQENMGQKVDL
jgi:1-acyl-sn-glycerol-3-phosphate acyltransferase